MEKIASICPECKANFLVPEEYLNKPINCQSCNTVVVFKSDTAMEAEQHSEHDSLLFKQIDNLKKKLLDLTNRNKLLSFKFSETAQTHIRGIDELPDVLYEKLLADEKLSFKALPEEETEPEDEKTDIFREILNDAKSEEQWKQKLKEVESDDPSSIKYQTVERELKNYVREILDLPKLRSYKVMSMAEIAKIHGLEPSYDLPISTGDQSENHTDNEIQTLFLPEKLERKLRTLRDRTRTSLQETGINILYVAFGFLEWYESSNSEKAHFAPLLLFPVEIKRELKRQKYNYTIKSIGEEIETNLTLSERMRNDFGLDIPTFEESDTPESYFLKVDAAIKEKSRWKIRRFIAIGLFSFARLVMYKDIDALQNSANGLGKQKNIRKLLLGSEQAPEREPTEYDIDTEEVEKITPLMIYDVDSSQHSAIVDVMQKP